ncbi:MAG TPA: hypothetical protein EYG79_05185 [Rhodobacteraceae bacterium]|nr:hypothetical protein [Paracoccaceae bacterium]
MIIGGHGAGKTTLALRLGKATGLPVIHIDKSYYFPRWKLRPLREALAELEAYTESEAWIMDGDDFRSFAPRLKRADMIVYLHVSTVKRIVRYAKRAIKSFGKPRVDLPDGCKGKLGLNGLKWVVFGYPLKMRPEMHRAMAEMASKIPVVHVRSEADIQMLEARLAADA